MSGIPPASDFRMPWNYPEGTYDWRRYAPSASHRSYWDIPRQSLGISRPHDRQRSSEAGSGRMSGATRLPLPGGTIHGREGTTLVPLPPDPVLHSQEMRIGLPPHLMTGEHKPQEWPYAKREERRMKRGLQKGDAAWKKKEKKLRKEQRDARKEIEKLTKEVRTLTEDLEADLRGEPRQYRGPAGEQMYVPPPPPPMPRLLPEGHYPPPPPPMPRNLPEERLVPPAYQRPVQLPETIHQPPAPPASPQVMQSAPFGFRRGNQVNPWQGRTPYHGPQNYPRSTQPPYTRYGQ